MFNFMVAFSLSVLTLIMPCALAAAAVYFLLSCKHGSKGNINVEIAARLAAEDTNLRSQGFLTHFLTTNRAPFVIGFVLPISLIYDA